MKKLYLLAFLLLTMAHRSPAEASRSFTELLDAMWSWNMNEYPEWATYLGKREGLDRWTDTSFDAIRRREAKTGEWLNQLNQIDLTQLSGSEKLDYELLKHDLERDLAGQRFPGEVLALNQLGGVHQSIAELMEIVPAQRTEDLDAVLARLSAVPTVIEQNIALLKKGLELGVTPPQITLRDVTAQIDRLLQDNSAENPILAPFRKESPLLTAEQKSSYEEKGLKVLRETVLPALQKFRKFVAEEYIPGCRQSIGMSALPDGAEWYAFDVEGSTTTKLSPEQIHQIGLEEVARIRKEMEKIMAQVEFKGTLAEFFEFLRTDKRFYYSEPGQLLTGYRDICKRADAELPRFFGKLPRMPYGVKEIPALAAPSKTTAYYEAGSEEAGRSGTFFANTYKVETRPKWEMQPLALHEAVPGHHIQISLAKELGEKHEMLRERGYTAYIEGWALYCEGLGREMGFYKDPYDDFGRLTYEMWRAVRLVVDTGIHAKGWTRDQALAYFRENTAKTEHDITVEVDRYIVWPAQALAYKIGERKIRELRARAEAELGQAFDLRRFHDVVLSEGATPLDVLEARVLEWIATKKKAR